MRHNQRSHAWEGSCVTRENTLVTGQKDFFYRLVGRSIPAGLKALDAPQDVYAFNRSG